METFKIYQLKVPAFPAITITSMKIKQPIWPVVYAPPRKYEPEEWTTGEVKWATETMGQVAAYALSDERKGEVGLDPFRVLDYRRIILDPNRLGCAEFVLPRRAAKTGLPRWRHADVQASPSTTLDLEPHPRSRRSLVWSARRFYFGRTSTKWVELSPDLEDVVHNSRTMHYVQYGVVALACDQGDVPDTNG